LHHLGHLATKVHHNRRQQQQGEITMAGRIAIVTGAGSGVGRASALALLNDGWSVALAGRRQQALEETAAMAKGGKAIAVPTDVTDPEQVAALFARVQTDCRRLDMLFNNAGGNVPSTNFGDFTFEMWRKVVAVNLDAMFLCANAAFRMMRDQSPRGGRIINNGSISAHAPRPGSVAYTSTKHAVTGLTKTIALDGRQFDICCGQVDIGNAATPMTQRMEAGVPQANGTTMVEPRMDVDHVGQQVLFMADLPLESNVQFVTIMATKMPFIGRG
jgi:NAD(P)-dependent dehydrogenase (short-subunit alcohol dehydrogenase family)